MELQHVNVKLFAERPDGVEQEKFTPIFHSWIQGQVCDELLIDVADYLHVPDGPGIVLIGNEADYSMDNSEHRLGLRYNRKTSVSGDNLAKFKQALRAALLACQRLEMDPRLEGRLKFNRQELELFINDRALAPNTSETLTACKSEVEKLFSQLLDGNSFSLNHNPDLRLRFGLTIKTNHPIDFETLLKKL